MSLQRWHVASAFLFLASATGVGCSDDTSSSDVDKGGSPDADASCVGAGCGGDGGALGNDGGGDAGSACQGTRCDAGPPPPAVAVLFGGAIKTGPVYALSDTWTFDGVTWTEHTPTTSPPARSGHQMATLNGVVVLFGGKGDKSSFNDTWIWKDGNWTQLTPAKSPSARSHFAMSTLNDKIVVFGGLTDAFANLNDTWVFDGSTWTQVLGDAPPASYSNSMAQLGSKVYLSCDGTPESSGHHMWSFDGATWAVLANNCLVATTEAMTSLGTKIIGLTPGSTNTFDGTTITTAFGQHISATTHEAMTTLNGKAIAFGGYNAGAYLNDTSSYDGTTWTQLTIANPPPARVDASLATYP